MGILYRPDLDEYTWEQLYCGLPVDMQKGIDRVMWTFKDKLINMHGVDQSAVLDFQFPREYIKLLYDPVLPEEGLEDLSDEEKMYIIASADPVTWVRTYLNYEPRVYQIVSMRHPARIRSLRWGRRTGKSTSMVWEMIWFASTNPGVTVILVCPLESQVKIIWDMVDEALLNSGIRPLKDAYEFFGILRRTKKPWEYEFSNGSRIKAFTSGARSGGKADSVRGNEGHMIIIDEMDLMMPDDLKAITAMMQQTSDRFAGRKRLIVSSTPNGRRDMFYAFSKKEIISEFWFPSFVNPYFTPADESEQRSLLTEEGFIHEVVADWGQQTTGVFKPALLDHVASEDFSYWNGRIPGFRGPIICGVDWDKYGAGVNIVAVANVDGILKTVFREEIERSQHEYTLGAGKDRVIELDKVFQFAYVYVDRGYGERQWEELVKEMPYGDMRVLGKNFSSSVLETDPATGAIVKEEFKPFLVDNAVNLYEKRKVMIAKNDEKFLSQLLGYMQLKISATGRPVFGSMDEERIGDHALMAWMMALLGHTEKYGDIIVPMDLVKPRAFDSNLALVPGDTRSDRRKELKAINKTSRPMTHRTRRTAGLAFDRPKL